MAKKHVLAILTILGPFFRNDHQIQNYRSSNSTEGRCFQIFKIPHSFWVISKKLKKRWVEICFDHVLSIQDATVASRYGGSVATCWALVREVRVRAPLTPTGLALGKQVWAVSTPPTPDGVACYCVSSNSVGESLLRQNDTAPLEWDPKPTVACS